jgi:hypothetical protein
MSIGNLSFDVRLHVRWHVPDAAKPAASACGPGQRQRPYRILCVHNDYSTPVLAKAKARTGEN